jgi:hypothetical protein
MIAIVGRPSDNKLDRELESPLDDAWSTEADEPVAATDANRTTNGTGEETIAPVAQDQIEPGVDVSIRAASEHDRTTVVGADSDRAARKIVDDLFAEATDHAGARMVDDSPAKATDHDRTTFGMGVATGTRTPITFFPAKPSPAELPDQKHGLVQPERSPLALVMGDMAASTGAPQAHASGDSSRFIAALVGDEPPALERIAEDESPITAIPPKLMARRRRRWIAAGALATTVVAGTLFGMTFRSAPALTTPTPTTPTPAPAPPPPAPAIAQPPAPPTSPQEPNTPPEAVPAARADVAMVAPSRTITKPSTRPAIAKKTVATSNTSAKRPSSTRMAAKPKAAAAKPSTKTSTVTVKKKKRSFF